MEGGGKQFTETWLVLEYCDKGNLQDACDRGVFVTSRSSGAAELQCNVRSVRCGQMPALSYKGSLQRPISLGPV